jgi:hypothetical protein
MSVPRSRSIAARGRGHAPRLSAGGAAAGQRAQEGEEWASMPYLSAAARAAAGSIAPSAETATAWPPSAWPPALIAAAARAGSRRAWRAARAGTSSPRAACRVQRAPARTEVQRRNSCRVVETRCAAFVPRRRRVHGSAAPLRPALRGWEIGPVRRYRPLRSCRACKRRHCSRTPPTRDSLRGALLRRCPWPWPVDGRSRNAVCRQRKSARK